MSWMQRIAEKLRRFNYGRYGMDQFGVAIVFLYLFTALLTTITRVLWFQTVGLAFAIYELFRMLSRNITARRRENNWFLKWAQPIYTKIGSFIGRKIAEYRDKDHKYFNCPTCHSRLRVPKGRGNLRVTCPKCGNVNNVKS